LELGLAALGLWLLGARTAALVQRTAALVRIGIGILVLTWLLGTRPAAPVRIVVSDRLLRSPIFFEQREFTAARNFTAALNALGALAGFGGPGRSWHS